MVRLMAMQGLGIDPEVLDGVINRLVEVHSARPGKQVQLSEEEIRQLCVVSREIFLQQPNLLELQAPIKICGPKTEQRRKVVSRSSSGHKKFAICNHVDHSLGFPLGISWKKNEEEEKKKKIILQAALWSIEKIKSN